MESFVAQLQRNVPDPQRWATRKDMRLAICDLDREDPTHIAGNTASAGSRPIAFETLTQAAHTAPAKRVN